MAITAYGYTHNCLTVRLPFVQCIHSMLAVCDEVIIIDAASSDGTYELLQAIPGLRLYRREYPYDTGTADSDLKREARELVTTDLCWGIDIDEVIHEKDYSGWSQIISQLSSNSRAKIVLPRVDFWSLDMYQLRTRYHAIHLNLPYLSVDVPLECQFTNPRTGHICSNGPHYDYVDTRTGKSFTAEPMSWLDPSDSELLTAFENPIESEEERARRERLYLEYIQYHPTLYHYSRASQRRKHLQQHTFDSHQYRLLFGELDSWAGRFAIYPNAQFPSFEAIMDTQAIMDHGRPYLVDVPTSLSHPSIMSSWVHEFRNMTEEDWISFYEEIREFALHNGPSR